MNEDFGTEKSSDQDLMEQVTAAQKAIVELEMALKNSVNQAEPEAISNRLQEAKDQYVALI